MEQTHSGLPLVRLLAEITMSEGVYAYSAAALIAMKATHTALSTVHTGAEETDLALSAVRIGVALFFGGVCLVCQPEAGQRHPGEADAKFFQRPAARDRFSQVLCEFIEFVVHAFPFVLVALFSNLRTRMRDRSYCAGQLARPWSGA
jgi:hypothetical protein